MLTILVLLVGLTLATAVIAYWSDNLGKKLGKKRVSLWGLRPRTTATFLTIASSWLIMIFTLGVMLTLFKPLRQALLRYDEVKAKESELKISKGELEGQVGGLNEQLATLTSQTTTLKNQVKTASENLKTVGDKLEESRTAATRARGEQQSAEKEAAAAKESATKSRASEQSAIQREGAARDNLKIVTNQRDATQKQRETAQRELKSAQSKLKQASADVKAADVRVKSADARVETAQKKATAAEAQVTRAQANLTKVRQDLKIAQTNARIAKGNAETARKNEENSKRLADASEKRADEADKRAEDAGKRAFAARTQAFKVGQELLGNQAKLEAQREQLININDQLANAKQFSDLKRQLVQGSAIRVPFGFTLVARTFEPGLSPGEAERQLHDLFGYVATKVLPGNKAEGKSPILSGAALRLAPQTVALPKEKESDKDLYISVEANEIYGSLATAISRTQTPLSVRLVADRNHLDEEPFLDTRFIILPERLALAADTELARVTLKQKLSDAKLFSALLDLTDAGREVARQNYVTPPLSPDAKDFYAPGSTERIFEALRKISALGGRARVSIVTDKAISTADQLSVRFEVEPLESVTTQANARVNPLKAPLR